jgi:CO dehydrogenase/acetyl-CoA synthase alpha subunit
MTNTVVTDDFLKYCMENIDIKNCSEVDKIIYFMAKEIISFRNNKNDLNVLDEILVMNKLLNDSAKRRRNLNILGF